MTEKLLDGAEMAILINRFEGIARKMTNTLYRTGRSGVLNRARDFSCCIVTHDCHLLAAAEVCQFMFWSARTSWRRP